jgi:hypothetical protein
MSCLEGRIGKRMLGALFCSDNVIGNSARLGSCEKIVAGTGLQNRGKAAAMALLATLVPARQITRSMRWQLR